MALARVGDLRRRCRRAELMAASLVRGRGLDAVFMVLYLAALLAMGWLLDVRQTNSIYCLRATVAFLMDTSVRAAREGGAPDAEIRARLFEQAKRELLEPRDCRGVERLT